MSSSSSSNTSSPVQSKGHGHGHTRSRASRSSIMSDNDTATATATSSSNTSATSSPPSAAKAAAITRQTSMARKRASLGAGSVNGAAKARTTNSQDGPASRRTSNAQQYMNGSSSVAMSSSSSGDSLATTADVEDVEDAELSRLTREQLVALVLRERKEKEETDTQLSTLSAEHATLSEQRADLLKAQALHESKLSESYASTERLEGELQGYMDSLETTREALKEAEKTSREAQKRLRDQAELFDSEQTKWNEIEQSLQSQVKQLNDDYQALLATQHARSASHDSNASEMPEHTQNASTSQSLSPSTPSHFATAAASSTTGPVASPTFQIPESTLEELSFLHTKISKLSSEQTELTEQVQRLTSELEELQRVNVDLQEENENYEVLLSERMIAGHFGHFAASAGTAADSGIGSSVNTSILHDGSLAGSRPPSSLDRLEEEEDLLSSDDENQILFESSGDGNISTGAVAANITPNRINRSAKKRQSMMGISGAGGLDLEAELDRARQEEEEERRSAEEKSRKKKERDNAAAARRKANQSTATMADGETLPNDVEGLRREIKLLRQENKGLSTYVSKILEKIIGIEGFEKVLSVEKDPKPLPTPTTASSPPPPTPAKPTPVSGRPPPLPARTPSHAATLPPAAAPLSPTPTAPMSLADTKKKNRFSMDWFGSSLFKGTSAATAESSQPSSAGTTTTAGTSAPAPGLKPMMLTGGPAQKTPTVEEDEDDRKTRARLQSEMRLLGIDTTSSPATQGGSPGSVKIGANRSPGQRISSGSGSYPTSPLPPGVPPKEGSLQRDSRSDVDTARTSGLSEGSSGSPATETVKIRGHRKRPSATFAGGAVPASAAAGEAVPRTRPVSVGLGLSYSKDSSSGSTWSAGSPSITADSEGDDKRSSAASQDSRA